MQEVLLASKRKLLHGNLELSWNEYLELAESVGRCGHVPTLLFPFDGRRTYGRSWKHTPSSSPSRFDVVDVLEYLAEMTALCHMTKSMASWRC